MRLCIAFMVVAAVACGVAYGLPTGVGSDGGGSSSGGAPSEPLGYWLDSGQSQWGDFDMDGDVDGLDFLVFQQCFNGPNRPSKKPSVDADWDRDGDVDGLDFLAFQMVFAGPNQPGRLAGPRPGLPQGENPEPLSVILVTTALGGLALRKWRRATRA